MSALRNLIRIKRKYSGNMARFMPVFLDNLLVRTFSKQSCLGPILVTWDINHKCNLRCIYCDCWKNKQAEEGLSLENKMDILQELGKAKVWYLSFCGGEPLLEENLGLLIREARKQKMLVNVSTNGLLLEEKSKMLVESGVNHITVSVESHVAHIQDSICGCKGALAKIKRGIESVKIRRLSNKPFISIRVLVNKKTYFHLPEYVKYWQGKVDDIMFKPICGNLIFFRVPQELAFMPKDKESFEESFSGLLEKFSDYDNHYNRGIPDYFFNKGALKKYRCFAGSFFADIDPQGNLYQCGEKREILGNLKQDEFMDVWNSKETKKVRALLKNSGCAEACWAESFLLNTLLSKITR